MRTFIVVLTATAALAQLGCGSDGNGQFNGETTTVLGQQCRQTAAQMRGCGLLTEGTFECNEPEGDTEKCFLECFRRANCTSLTDAFCSQSGPTAECAAACQAANQFTCGDGSTIPEEWICDQDADCEDESDEANCPTDQQPIQEFTCADGGTIPADWKCDDEPDCDDGSDEVGCPATPMFTCGDGETIRLDYKCDENMDCEDGSDEVGCPARAMFVCPDGSNPFGFDGE